MSKPKFYYVYVGDSEVVRTPDVHLAISIYMAKISSQTPNVSLRYGGHVFASNYGI